ncbi:MAG: TolC family protein [Bryobacterales bacterium]
MLLRLGVWLLLPVAALAQTHSTYGDPHLAELIADALERNPQVREAFAHYQAARARVPQATALPDPMLSVTQHARTPETRVGPQTTLVSVSQRFPWFGKLSDQGKLAAKRASVQAELYEARRAEVVRQLKLAYFDLRYIDQALVIAGEETELLEHYETLAQARYSQAPVCSNPSSSSKPKLLVCSIALASSSGSGLTRNRCSTRSATVSPTNRSRLQRRPSVQTCSPKRKSSTPSAASIVRRSPPPSSRSRRKRRPSISRGGNTIPTSPSGRRGAM